MVAVQNKPIKPVTMMKNTNECFKEVDRKKSTFQTETGCFFSRTPPIERSAPPDSEARWGMLGMMFAVSSG